MTNAKLFRPVVRWTTTNSVAQTEERHKKMLGIRRKDGTQFTAPDVLADDRSGDPLVGMEK